MRPHMIVSSKEVFFVCPRNTAIAEKIGQTTKASPAGLSEGAAEEGCGGIHSENGDMTRLSGLGLLHI